MNLILDGQMRMQSESKAGRTKILPQRRCKKRSKSRKTAMNLMVRLRLEPNRVLEGPAFPLKLQDKHPWLDAQLKTDWCEPICGG